MRSSSLRRACTTVLGLLVSATALTAAAPPAAAECPGGNPGLYGSHVSLVVAPQPAACYDVGTGPAWVYIDGGTMLTASPTFDCGTWTAGSIGDPSQPATYVPFRIGTVVSTQYQAAQLCFEARGVQLTAGFVANGTPPRVVVAPTSGSEGPGCDGGSRDGTPFHWVWLDVAGEYQWTWVGVGTPGGDSDNDCAGTAGPLATCEVTNYPPEGWELTDPSHCPTGATLAGLPEDAVAFATETSATLLATVDGVVTEVVRTVDPYVTQLLGIVNPIVTEAYETVWETLGVLPVRVADDADGCTVSVATFGGYAVSRSATGQVPASVCVTTSSGVTRVTIG